MEKIAKALDKVNIVGIKNLEYQEFLICFGNCFDSHENLAMVKLDYRTNKGCV